MLTCYDCFCPSNVPSPCAMLESQSTISLKLLERKDAASFFKLISDNREQLKYWVPWVAQSYKLTDIKYYIEEAHHKYKQGKAMHMAIWHEGTIVGNINLNPIDPDHKKAAIGYWLDQSAQGQGIMLEACRQLMAYAFEKLFLNRLEIVCDAENMRSRAIPEKLGFVQEGRLRDYLMAHQKSVDVIVYALLKKEWLGERKIV